MSIRRITVHDFRSFRWEHTLAIPEEPGLYLVCGENEDDPGLQGNAVGKSTLWDALFWCLEGSTTRGVRAGNVQPWGVKKSKTWVEVETGEGVVRRSQSPNSLTINGEISSQEQVDRLVGMNAAAVSNSLLFGQFAPFFFDLSPTEKLQQLTDVLGLNLWEQSGDLAKSRTKELERKQSDKAQAISNLVGRIATYEEMIRGLKSQAAGAEVERKKRWNVLRQELRDAKDDYEAAEEDLADLKEPDKEGEDKLLQQYQASHTKAVELSKKEGEADGAIKSIKVTIERVKSLGAECSLCLQSVDARYKEEQLADLNDQLKCESEARQEIRDRLRVELEWGRKVNLELESLRKVNRQLISERSGLERELEEAERRAEHIRDMGKELKAEGEKIEKQVEEAEAKLVSAQKEKEHLELDMIDIVRDLEAVQYWVNGFRELRLWIIDQTLLELEINVNQSLPQLGLSNWRVEFAVERETKSKSVSRGFNVMVSSPDSREPAPWNSWSGGELQRLRLAGSIGFANLIRSRMQGAVDHGLEVWDEPTAHLSGQGVNDLLQWLENRAESEQRVIFVIDHRILEHAGFKGRLTVYRRSGQSHLEWT